MKTFDLTLTIPVTVTLQDEEWNECRALARAIQLGPGDSYDGVLRDIIARNAERCAIEALQLGRQQYRGALIVVEAKGAE